MTKRSLMREHLCNTFMDMCETWELSKISVAALVREADVARTTFYNNFRDINDLINYIPVNYYLQSSMTVFSPPLTKEAFEYALAHKGFFQQLPAHLGQNNFRETFTAWSQQTMCEALATNDLDSREKQLRCLQIDLLCAGVVDLFLQWCATGMQTDVDLLVEAFVRSSPGFLLEFVETA